MSRIKGAVKVVTKDDGVSRATEEEVIADHAKRLRISVEEFRKGLRVVDKLQEATRPARSEDTDKQEEDSDDEELKDFSDE